MSSKRSRSDRIKARYECEECGTKQSVHVAPADAGGSIRYACSGPCGDVTEHRPTTTPDWFDTTGF